MLFTELLNLSPTVIGQVADACPAPNPFQLVAILALVGGSGVLLVSTGVGIWGIASTLIGLVTAGVSIDAVPASITAFLGLTGSSANLFTYLIGEIQKILGC
ncbi:hypothetical protein H6F88_06125 [Oculatella sp. FACHB-28]|uniref:hypothetical protein n=1 Tax=Oculatella sp. FACHB-28 TaxID=2692845 RepID=UPI001685AFC7|nr:hypothetical protein [Oculatella sp. FACHB-28]MBD2055601.1 hypothetical protein [Oculatella sp. FACHB-28]